MTFCRACGLNSRTDDFCELCRRPLASAAETTLQMPPQSQTVRRVSLTGEVVETTLLIPTRMADQTQTMAAGGPATTYGSVPLAQYPAPPMNLGAALPASTYSAEFMAQAADEGPPIGERWEKGLAIALPVIAVSMLAIHFAPAAMLAIVFANLLILPAVLGAIRAIPRFEDAIADCTVVLVVAILLGPLVALIVYLLTCMVKQECNVAIVALLAINLLVKALFGIAFAPEADTASLIMMWGFLNWLGFFGVCLSFLGWLCGGFFRPIGE